MVQIKVFTIFIYFAFLISAYAGENNSLPDSSHDDVLADILNPFNSPCYDWRGSNIPCDFKRQYGELLSDKSIPDPRFIDNKNGTVTDNLTGLIWLRNTNCFGMMIWNDAMHAVNNRRIVSLAT